MSVATALVNLDVQAIGRAARPFGVLFCRAQREYVRYIAQLFHPSQPSPSLTLPSPPPNFIPHPFTPSPFASRSLTLSIRSQPKQETSLLRPFTPVCSCTETMISIKPSKPGVASVSMGDFHCRFEYDVTGGTKEEWEMFVDELEDGTYSCTVGRYEGVMR